MLKRTNLEQELRELRDRDNQMELAMQEVMSILHSHESRDTEILEELESSQEVFGNTLTFDKLEVSRIYHITQIKQLCVDFRLRFLPTKYFKGRFPRKTLNEIKRLEDEHQTQLKGFHIVAPSKLFKLENADDPLLFVPIGNGYYYLVDKWGKDLHPLRKWMVMPMKSMGHLLISLLMISFLVTLLIPMELFTREENTTSTFWLLYFFVFKMVGSIVIFYGFALGKNFNPAIWNSKFYNS